MKKYINPPRSEWTALCQRPGIETEALTQSVSEILKTVREKGDAALYEYAERFDKQKLDQLQATAAEIEAAEAAVSPELKAAIQLAYDNISSFHRSQLIEEPEVETTSGVKCWRKSVGIEKVGLYIPGGSAPLFSTILMLGIPAKLAGCKEIVLCSPASAHQSLPPAILYTANLIGIDKIFKIGGAQAIAAMAYGTETVPSVYKIFGPGNQYVTRAKELVQEKGIAIDMPAGPSEVLVIADQTSNPAFVAADLLSQAEHGADSQVILLCNKKKVADACLAELKTQLEELPRKTIAKQALQNSKAIVMDSLEDCLALSNEYAPEHLIIALENANEWTDKIVNAGSVFMGNYSCESAGDYASGTNHTLPTNGFAKSYSGVSVDSFVKKITFQQLTAEGIQKIGPAIEIMAEAEELMAHKNAVSLRLKELQNV